MRWKPAQSELLVDENNNGELVDILASGAFPRNAIAVDTVAAQHLEKLIRAAHETSVVVKACLPHCFTPFE